MWVFLLAGCTTRVGGNPGEGVAACGDSHPSDAGLFAALTSNAWTENCTGGGPLPPTCTTIQLGADGAFEWRAVSDYVERDQHGDWNFSARADNAGIVCLDTGAVLPFMFDGETLYFGRLALSRGDASSASGTRDDLVQVVSDPVYAQMTAHPWTKTNSFDLFMDAQDFTLARDGSYTASYRGGECTHGGTWGIDLDPRSYGPTPVLIDRADANTCDLRGNPATLPSVDVPRIDAAGRLVMYSSAYRAPSADPRPWFSFDGYSDEVATSSYLDRELSTSAPTSLDLDIENRGTSPKTLASLTARTRPTNGALVDLASANLTGVVLAPGDHHAVSLSIAPAVAGDALLEFELDYSDSTQPYQSRGDYTVTIAP